MNKQMINHKYVYKCEDMETGLIMTGVKLPPILKALREATNYTFKIPHGNRVRTFILEEGSCVIYDKGKILYIITMEERCE